MTIVFVLDFVPLLLLLFLMRLILFVFANTLGLQR